ncbi:hypothetical protein [Hymenobacter defluvii]|uniref:Uncharacterized protein n=1 Tax=Hymenobacter defluvii TaxID=2054411 RepID=A0ABS3TAU8_9BACT|nr:hypothetical protein [Hymenobacter defluvii]MBO3270786.1 hypothetical protein [Hymenobacter defluvii]
MSDFKPKPKKLSFKTIPTEDTGINISDALVLLEDSEYKEDILAALKVEDLDGAFIAIPGATSLVNSVLMTDSLYEKFDLRCRYENLVFERPDRTSEYHEEDIDIKFDDTESSRGLFIASPAYDAQSDFLEKTGSMSKYAKKLITHSRIDMVYTDLEEVRSIYNASYTEKDQHEFKYRIIKNLETNKYYYRAITSTDRYKDYNIKLSVFAILVAIHRLSISTGDEYILSKAEHTESKIRVFFEKIGKLEHTPLGDVKFIIELRNSEIRKGAVKYSGVCAIVYDNKENDTDNNNNNDDDEIIDDFLEYEDEFDEDEAADDSSTTNDIYLTPRPNRLKYLISSIKHNETPKKALSKMDIVEAVERVEKLIYSDLSVAPDLKSLEMIRILISNKIDALQNVSTLGKYKSELQSKLPETIENIEELLRLVNKLNLVVPEKNIDAKEYLRYLFFEAIVEKGRPGFSKLDSNEE